MDSDRETFSRASDGSLSLDVVLEGLCRDEVALVRAIALDALPEGHLGRKFTGLARHQRRLESGGGTSGFHSES